MKLLFALAMLAQATSAQTTPGPQPGQQARPIPPPTFLLTADEPLAPISARGVDLIREGATLDEERPTLQEGAPFTARIAWRAEGVITDAAQLTLTIEGSGPTMTGEFAIASRGWQVGGAYTANYEFTIPGMRCTGRAVLRASLEAGQGPTTLFAVPVFIQARAWPSKVASERIATAFGNTAIRLGQSFRLGPGASVRLALPSSSAQPVAAIGLISRMDYAPDLEQGEPVCAISTIDGEELGRLLAGESTALGNIAYYPPGDVEAKAIALFETWPAPQPNPQGAPYTVCLYQGIVSLAQPAEGGELELAYLRDGGILDVQDVVVLPPQDPTP